MVNLKTHTAQKSQGSDLILPNSVPIMKTVRSKPIFRNEGMFASKKIDLPAEFSSASSRNRQLN